MPLSSSVMTSHTARMLQSGSSQAGSFPWMGSTTTPSPANATMASTSSRDVASQRWNVLRVGRRGVTAQNSLYRDMLHCCCGKSMMHVDTAQFGENDFAVMA